MKEYYENIAWYDYLIFLVYFGLFSYLLHRIGDVFLGISKKALNIFIAIFGFYFLLVIGDSFFNYLPYLPDTELYSFMISSGQYPETSSDNILVLYYISLFIGLICLGSPVIFVFFCIFLYLVSLMVLLQAWKKIYKDFTTGAEVTFSILAFLWPAPVLYITAPLRESFILFGFAIFISGFLNFIYFKKWKSLIIGSILISAIRLQSIVFVLPILGLLTIWKLKIHNLFKASIVLATIAIAFLVIRYVLIKKPLSPETMAEFRNINISKAGPLGYGNVDWHSYSDMMSDYPFIIAQFFFSPLPIFVQHDPVSTFIPFLDLIFLIILLLVVLSRLRYHWKHQKEILLLIIFFIILFGGYEYHITGAVRHRMPIVLLLMLLSAPAINSLFSRKPKIDETKHIAVDNK